VTRRLFGVYEISRVSAGDERRMEDRARQRTSNTASGRVLYDIKRENRRMLRRISASLGGWCITRILE
jgi:hypothetical protein